MWRNFVTAIKRVAEFVAGQSRQPFPQEIEHAPVMHRLSKKALPFRLRPAWKLRGVALNKVRVRYGRYKERHRGGLPITPDRSFICVRFPPARGATPTSIFLYFSFSLSPLSPLLFDFLSHPLPAFARSLSFTM